jgi:flagellar L-ring protein precursor FlgH
MEKKIRIAWVIGVLAVCAVGCVTTSPPAKVEPIQRQEIATLRGTEEGSLWAPQYPLNYYADVKARNVGDIVTINIVESAKASKNATTNTSRSSGLEASWSGLFEQMAGNWAAGSAKVDFGSQHDGKGETTRSSFLNAYITTHVVDVMPNGNLFVRGTRQVQVNNETQFIRVEGLIRPEDISSNNIVLSTFVAEAKIELFGQGVVSDKQQVGWLTRILDYVWPF